MRSGGDAASSRAALSALAGQLKEASRERAVTGIREFLASGEDASTQDQFALANDGFLTAAPTVRVFLLDYLERLDPAAAAAAARQVLATSPSADEWAVALRSLAHGAPEERELLRGRLHELLRNPTWRQNPTQGWLEAFDVAVYCGGTEFVPELTELMRPIHGKAVNHAAFLALDRLVTREPSRVLKALLDNPESLAEREAARAGMMARADVRDAGQRVLLEKYLLDPARSVSEIERFAAVYPNANQFVSPNLLTPHQPVVSGAAVQHDRAALKVVDEWLADERFIRLRPHLERSRERLVELAREIPVKP